MFTFNVSKAPKDFWAGAIYFALGLAAVAIATDYDKGTLLRMGPGYVPTVLGYALMVVGLAALIRAFWRVGEKITPVTWRGLALVIVPIVLFGMLARGAGLVPSVALLVVVSAYASEKTRLLPTIALAIGMSIFCWLLFAKLLGVPLQPFGAWLVN